MEDALWNETDRRGFNEDAGRSAQLSIPEGCAPLFGDRALARALHRSLVDEVPYPSEAAEAHRDVLRALLNRADGLVKREFVPDDGALARLAAVMADLAQESRLQPHGLPPGAAGVLADVSLRRARTVLRVALGIAVTGGHDAVEVGDVRAALAIVGAGISERCAIGFVR